MDGWVELGPETIGEIGEDTPVRVMWKSSKRVRLDDPIPLRDVLAMLWYAVDTRVPIFDEGGFVVCGKAQIVNYFWSKAVRLWIEDTNDFVLK